MVAGVTVHSNSAFRFSVLRFTFRRLSMHASTETSYSLLFWGANVSVAPERKNVKHSGSAVLGTAAVVAGVARKVVVTVLGPLRLGVSTRM